MTKRRKIKTICPGGIAIVSNEAMMPVASLATHYLKEMGITDVALQEVDIKRFPAGEILPRIRDNVRAKEVFLFFGFTTGSTQLNDDLVALFLTLNALDNADCGNVTAVLPYFPYQRQDRKTEPRTSLSAAWVIETLSNSQQLKRVVTIDMHAAQLESTFSVAHIKTDHLPGSILMSEYAKKKFKTKLKDLVVVAPDVGSGKRARKLAQRISKKTQVAIFDKDRNENGITTGSVTGASIKGKICLLNDDIIDTCETIIGAAQALLKEGAKGVVISATHPVFSDKNGTTAIHKLNKAGIPVVITDTIVSEKTDFIMVQSTAELLAKVIAANVTPGGSVSELWEGSR